MKRLLVATLAVATAGCFRHHAPTPVASIPPVRGKTQQAFALRYVDVAPGFGALAAAKKCLYVNYTGWLTNGTKFDSSRDPDERGNPGKPISFPQGARRVIAGWDLGFDGMRVGAKRRLFIPYQLAYGEAGRDPIPPKAELIFDVELMAVADPLPAAAPAPGAGRGAAATPQCPTWEKVSSGT
ncbi:MAG TPA: FKBP-type peptidyl-prolyl cis-trans isomerase [Gemmatimonadaceae bacterium]|jgi:peptidylprolyl isomerase